MAYTKQTWQDLPSKTTPINASRLGHIEQGIYDAASTADTAASNASSAISGLADKVDKVEGKGLSTNDFTDTLKTKLDGIATGAEVNVQADYAQTNTEADDYIKNKPTLGTSAYKNSTSVVTDSTDLVESGAVCRAIGIDFKNLFYSPYNSVISGGYTAVKNSDSTFTVNGLDTSQSRALIIGTFTFKAGITYMMSGCPTGISDQIYLRASSSDYTIQKIDNGSGVELSFDTDTTLNIQIRCGVNQTANNLVFSPMIELGDTKTAYEPYHEPVEQTLRDAEVVQGKNLLPNNAISQQGSGVIYTVNSNGTDSIVGTASAITQLSNVFDAEENYNNVILTGIPQKNLNIYMTLTDMTTSTDVATDIGEGSSTFNLVKGHRYNCKLIAGTSFSAQTPIIVSPMISTEGGDYEPYYIPLKDVVPNKCDNSVIAPVENQPTCQKDGGYAVGEHFIRDGAFCTCKQAIPQGGSFTLNTNYKADTVADLCKFVTAGLQSSNGTITNSYAYLAGALISYMFRYTPSNDIPANTDIITGMKNPFVAYGNMAGALFFDANGNVYRIKLSFASSIPRFTTLDPIPADTNLRGSITYICQL